MQLPRQISSKALAVTLNTTERAVRKRAQKCGWKRVYQRSRGGACHLYMVSSLPADVRTALADYAAAGVSQGAREGAARACAIDLEQQAAIQASRKAKAAGLAAYNRLSPQRQAQARARREILDARDAFISTANLPKKKGTDLFIREYKAGAIRLPDWVEDAAGRRNGKVPLSWASLYRWEKSYEDEGMAGLSGHYAPTRESEIADHMQRFIKGLISDRPHLKIPTIHMAMRARFDGQHIPSQSAVRRFVNKWKNENESLILYKTSFDTWRSRHMAAFGDASENIERLNQLWEFDSTPADVMLIDGRHSLVGVIDVYSRRAKLQVTPTSKSSAIAALLRRAMLDWGLSEGNKMDNGTDYTSEYIVRVHSDLDIDQILCREFHPEDKPHIERFFGTFARSITELLPGYIGHSVAERKQIEDRRSFAQRIMKQGGDPVEIKLTSGQLQKICDDWCNAVYHHTPHESLNGKTPAETARLWRHPIRRIEDERALDILLSPAPDKEGTRVIGKKGIKVDNGRFIAPELAPHIGETVFVLLDQTDYGTIYVYLVEPDGSKTYLCRAVDPQRTGHDRYEIASIGKAAQERVMREGASELKKLAREAKADAIYEEILQFHKRQRANVHEFRQRSEPYTTQALEQAGRVIEDIRREQLGPMPIPISAEEDRSAAELIDMNQARRDNRPLPATEMEKYEQMLEDLRCGVDLCDSELAWMKRFELWLETGERSTY